MWLTTSGTPDSDSDLKKLLITALLIDYTLAYMRTVIQLSLHISKSDRFLAIVFS